MAVLFIPDQNITERDPLAIKAYFNARGIVFEQWEAQVALDDQASQDEVIAAYRHQLEPLMQENGYQTADVINVTPDHPMIEELSQKFLTEHTHTEDEVRYFVDGEGLFWFNLEKEGEPIFCLLCEKGDLISVPAFTKHWFDFGPKRFVKCIRVFTDQSGWIAHYTQSGVDSPYNALNLPN